MPIYERGGTFMVSVGSGKDRFRGHAKTRAEAEKMELEEKLRRKDPTRRKEGPTGRQIDLGKGKTLRDAYDLTMRLHWKGEKAEKTNIINAGAVLKHLGEDTLLVDITAEDINEMVFEFEDQGNSGSTINKKTSCLSMMFKTAEEQKWIKDWPKPPRKKENKHRIRWVDEAEEAKILELCDHLGLDDLRDYVIVAIDTGFRRGEMLKFQPKDFSNGLLHLHAGSTKNDDARSVPATKRVTEILNRRASRPYTFYPLTRTTLRTQWERIRGLLEMDEDPQFIVHMLRHTCASRLVQRGVPLAVVQKWMGHRNINTTLRYAHLAPDSLLGAKAALEAVKAVPVGVTEVAAADF